MRKYNTFDIVTPSTSDNPLQCPTPLRNNNGGNNSAKTRTVNEWAAPTYRALWRPQLPSSKRSHYSAKDTGPAPKVADLSDKDSLELLESVRAVILNSSPGFPDPSLQRLGRNYK